MTAKRLFADRGYDFGRHRSPLRARRMVRAPLHPAPTRPRHHLLEANPNLAAKRSVGPVRVQDAVCAHVSGVVPATTTDCPVVLRATVPS